uniref:Uncharacterized protein n=1 Tax=Oryza brachyantha TaxID=4533 RepID=J3M9L1_ORYBR
MAEADQAAAAAAETEWERDVEAAVPMSPAGRLFRETHFNCYIVAVIGLGSSVDVAAARAGLEATLVRHPRFCSVQVSNEASKRAKPKWVRTTVNLDNHLIFPELDPTATSANPDQVVEDYMSTLSTQPMDHSRPLWEFHTVNDVLVGVTSAALSRYYFRKTSDNSREKRTRRKNIRMRSALLVNIRKTPGLHVRKGCDYDQSTRVYRPALAEMMNSSKNNAARWGNLIGYIVLPFRIAMYDDPLEYIRQGKRTVDRKKNSLEAIFTYWSGNLIVKLFGIKTAAALCYGMIANTTLSFSSMVGPAEKVEFYGHPIEYIAPSVYGHPHALTIHYQSYMNIIKLVLAVDDAQFPDAHQLLNDFAESLKLIRQAASTKS